ncbi:ABC transporter substrate-binding protein [Kribbella sp. NPDC059898]|uniref:ABC transporter substrate-binding protein n=1 Tax=Kribbella sp. NPDC059898 TaxID=3346995 RepID=UPI00365800C5
MKNLSGRVLTAAVAIAMLTAACSGGGATQKADAGSYDKLPAEAGKPKAGGTVTVALSPGLNPNYIYPYEPASQNGGVIARGLLWRALYRASSEGDKPVDPELSMAEQPTYSADRKTVTIKLKDYKWSDGTPVTADDVVFSIALLKAAIAEDPANWSFYTPGQFPDGFTVLASDPRTVTMKLTKAYNPSYLLSMLELIYVLPSKAWNIAKDAGPHLDYHQPKNAQAIYTYLTKSSESQATFTSNPLWQMVNGPYKLKTFDPATGSYSLVPNKAYGGPGESRIDQIDFKTFTSAVATFNQFKAGTLTVGMLDSGYIAQVDALKAQGYNVYGAPAPARLDYLTINFKNTTNNFDKVIAQLYVRQALQQLIDQPGYIKSRGVYNGAATENYSTAGVGSPYPPDFGTTPPYPHDTAAAQKLLTDHGWKVVPDGTTTCERPGSGPDQCGAGIPAGQTLSFNLIAANSPSYVGARDVAFVSAAKKLGITVRSETKAVNYIYENYGNTFAPAKKNEWAMVDSGSLYQAVGYPSSNTLFNTTGSFNLGSYSNPEADKLIEASTFGADPKALSAEVSLLGKDLPVLYLPTPDTLVVWKDTLSGPPSSFRSLLSFLYSPELWYFHD